MRTIAVAAAAVLALSGCSTTPHSLAPDSVKGPTSYVCYSTMLSEPVEVRSVAERQCRSSGLGVSSLIGQSWTPMRCGFLTPTVAAFQCGYGSYGYGLDSLWLAPTPAR